MLHVTADLVGDITKGISQFFSNAIGTTLNDLMHAITPFLAMIGNTPTAFTTGNPVVHGAWLTMVGVADAFLGLYVTMKIIQMMHGEATGTTHMPLSQFVPKVILTVLLIHASAFLGEQLIAIVNALCELVRTNVTDFLKQVNGGKLFDANQNTGLSVVLAIVFGISLVRVVFQAIKRIVFFNVLFVFSGPAFLMSLDLQTAPWFQFWFRTYLVTILEQFIQFLTFSLGFQFLLAIKQTGFTGFILAIAMLNLTAEIPSIMARFASSTGGSAPGLGSLVRGAVTAAALLF
ncbi:hypothetical protein KSF_108060 [Reticulibacter mediterranei]|uniref:Conjugal transfer protein TrbL n=1 Tax=Reticulibacter mediterranei TaxID=2778369 RepID=A0A8J3IUC5_9CHLR|nr:conjugal transfer protein TrbL family protein [Reticulibacter mediterranei]GHP00759.1 hypothetical protein KSF_108060 [Reticulibacter mediterranei]